MPDIHDIPSEVIDRNLNGFVTLKEFRWVAQSYVSPALTKIWQKRMMAASSS